MRNKKPLIQIDKFSGAGQNGILYCQGFYPEVDNQKSVMGEGFITANVFNTTTTGFSNVSNIYGAIALSTLANQDNIYNLYIDGSSNQRIWAYQTIGDTIKDGQIHLNSLSSTYCLYPDIIETTLGNILYPSGRNIGRGVRFKATGGSTTTIIDTTRDFTTLGYTAGDKVTNLKTGIEYTLTVVGTDTLTFVASGTNTTESGDECIAWQDDRFETTISKASWQRDDIYWVKQIKLYGDLYYFTNGNYLGQILGDESAVDKDFKQLPAKHQAIALSVNNAKILVSANINGKGSLLLWDGYSDGWNNIIKTDAPVNSLVEYNSGWIYVLKGIVYYTDGWQVQRLYSLNQTRNIPSQSLTPASHNGLVISDGFLYVANNRGDTNLLEAGVYVIDLNNVNNGFSLIKVMGSSRTTNYPYSIFINNRFTDTISIEVGGDSGVSSINPLDYGANYQDKSLIMSIPLPDQMKISGIGLNLSRYLKNLDQDINYANLRKIGVSIGDGDRGLINFAQVGIGNTKSLVINGLAYINNEIGDEVYISDTGSSTYSERTFITNITGKGTSAENWSISPDLSDAPINGTNLKMIRVKSLGIKTVDYNDLKDEIFFFTPNALMTNKLFIEIVFYSGANSMPLNINEINVYGE